MRFKPFAKDLRRVLLPLLLGWLSLSTAQATEIVTYYHNDALGSPIAATDEKGRLIWREEYGPYGERILRQAGNREPMGYTGKSEEAALGLTYFGARWYDPELGRFLSPDPAPFQEDNPHSFNRYIYGNANPYRYVDPDGNSPLDIGFFALDAVNFGLAAASGDPQAIASAGVDLAVGAVGLASPVPGIGLAIKAARATDKVGDAARVAKGITTPYGIAKQSDNAAALAARAQVKEGATLYRIGTTGKSQAVEAQFWSLEHPLSPGFAQRYGIPAENVNNANFIEAATLKPGTPFITRPAPGYGSNTGGGIEAVVPSGGVQMRWFSYGGQ